MGESFINEEIRLHDGTTVTIVDVLSYDEEDRSVGIFGNSLHVEASDNQEYTIYDDGSVVDFHGNSVGMCDAALPPDEPDYPEEEETDGPWT
jgi:hypothetical protein